MHLNECKRIEELSRRLCFFTVCSDIKENVIYGFVLWMWNYIHTWCYSKRNFAKLLIVIIYQANIRYPFSKQNCFLLQCWFCNSHTSISSFDSVFAFAGAVPVPESLLLSSPPLIPLEPISTASLLSSVSPVQMEELRRTCKSNMHCIHDTIASGSSELGLHTLEARQRFEELALIYGETWENSLCFCYLTVLIHKGLTVITRQHASHTDRADSDPLQGPLHGQHSVFCSGSEWRSYHLLAALPQTPRCFHQQRWGIRIYPSAIQPQRSSHPPPMTLTFRSQH